MTTDHYWETFADNAQEAVWARLGQRLEDDVEQAIGRVYDELPDAAREASGIVDIALGRVAGRHCFS